MNSIFKGCKQLQPVSHCNSPAIGNGRPQRFFLAFSPHSLHHLPNTGGEEFVGWTDAGWIRGSQDPFSLYKFRLQTPRPANRRSTENRRRKRKETREKERGRTMKKGETRIGNEGRDEGRNGDGGSVNKRWAGCGNAKTRCCACSVENKKLDGWGRARRGGTRSLSRELCRVFCRVIRTPPLPLRPRVLITRPF